MKKLVMAFGLSLALSSAVNAQQPIVSCPAGSDVVGALSNNDTQIIEIIEGAKITGVKKAYVPSTLKLTSVIDEQNGHCHYQDASGTNFLTIVPDTADKK
jgi:hypothetical protein